MLRADVACCVLINQIQTQSLADSRLTHRSTTATQGTTVERGPRGEARGSRTRSTSRLTTSVASRKMDHMGGMTPQVMANMTTATIRQRTATMFVWTDTMA